MSHRARLAAALLAWAACLLPQAVSAQSYPSRPIRIIVPFPAGGTTDIIARLVAQRMSETMGQPAGVGNPGGAGGCTGREPGGKRGPAAIKQELLAGRLQLGGDQLSSSLAEIKRGSLKALATNAPQRLAVLPQVPTVRELGFPKLEAEGWNGLFAPAKTPREIIERLQRETAAAVRHPDSVKRLTDLAAEPAGPTPAEADAGLRPPVAQFRPIIRELGVTID